MTEMLGYGDDPIELPDWLRPDKELLKRTMRSGNNIATIVIGALEHGLQVSPGALTDAHRIEDPSDDFLRLLRYPGLQPGMPRDDLRFPAHKDFTSLGILFTWLGGLQLPALGSTPGATSGPKTGPLDLPEDQWRWVKPVPGTAIVNVGLQLETLTNKALTSGLHRVVRAPGEQQKFDRYSVLVGTRAANNFPMKPLQSAQISPVLDEATAKIATMTSGQWGSINVGGFDKWVADRTQRQETLIIQ
jgi:isopenicillin N synthase-like dioxygenase